MSKKKTQVELLQEVADLLEPISNLARYNIGQINAQLKAQADAQAQANGESTQSEGQV